MKGLDLDAFISLYVERNEDPMKDYETVQEALRLEEQTKAAIAAQMEAMALAKGGSKESKKEAKKRRKEEAKRNKQEAKALRKSRASTSS